ncbi:TPA: hypothetical protein ACJ5DT_002869 [Legionella pneumophila]
MDSKKALNNENQFWQINNDLINIGATYVSLLIFDGNNEVVYSKSSNLDWADEFTSTGLYKSCHLLNEANSQMSLHDNSFTIVWDLYSPQTESAKALDDIRKSKNITHGVGFCLKNGNGSRLMLNVAGKYTDINFGFNVLKKRKEVYHELYTFTLRKQPHLISELLLQKSDRY